MTNWNTSSNLVTKTFKYFEAKTKHTICITYHLENKLVFIIIANVQKAVKNEYNMIKP